MENNSSYDDIIEKYLDGTLSKVEKELFDERLKDDYILSNKLSERIMLQKSWVKDAQHEYVKKHINRHINIEKLEQKSRRNIWLVAASLTLLLSVGSLFFYRSNQNLNDREFLSRSKINNIDKGDILVQGQQNEIKKYGSVDSLNNIAKTNKNYLPTDGVVYFDNDTIVFNWPDKIIKEKLLIFDEKGFKAVEVQLKSSDVEYKLLPSSLKPGTYTWNILPNVLNYKFTIKK